MKSFHDFLKEDVPTNAANAVGTQGGYGQDATATGPVAGYTERLFPNYNQDLLSQDYQTPAEPGDAKWRFANVWPVMKVTLDNEKGGGPSIDAMVDASKEFVGIQDEQNEYRRMKTFNTFMEEKKCPPGMKWDPNLKDCVPSGKIYGMRWWGGGRHHHNGKENGNGNGNGNGSHNGNGGAVGNGGNGNGGGGNGGGGNGG